MKKILILILCFVLCACNDPKKFSYTSINSSEAKELMQDNNYVIIDVRTKEEYDDAHVEGSINIPYDIIESEIKEDKSTKIFVYCRSGRRSKIAAEALIKMGYVVYDLGSYATINLK